jgi:protein SCO1/2
VINKLSARTGAGLFFLTFLICNPNQALGHDPIPPPSSRKAHRREVHVPIRDFSLTDQNGKPFRLASLRGKVVVLSFIYTTCPDVCPLITSSLRMMQNELSPEERSSVFLLSITTDPEVDRPKVLKSYAERYKVDFSAWSFLTGDVEALAAVWKNFGIKVEGKARGLVNHTSLTAVIDRKGVMRFAYSGAAPDQKTVLRDMRALLAGHP